MFAKDRCRAEGKKKLAAEFPKEVTKVRVSMHKGSLGLFTVMRPGCLYLAQKGWHKTTEGVARQIENARVRLRVSEPSRLLADLLLAQKVREQKASSMDYCMIQGSSSGAGFSFQSPVVHVPLAVFFCIHA